MTDIMFRIPSDETVCRVEITPGVVDGTGAEPVVEHGERTAVPAEKKPPKKYFAESRPRAHNQSNQYGRGTRFPRIFNVQRLYKPRKIYHTETNRQFSVQGETNI